jgi:ubiquinone/menaquinone biosynthesis C-methylase UbiE
VNTEQTREEFARQVKTMSASAVFNAQEVLEAIAEASRQGPGRKALDVGCGPGIVAEALARRGGQITGIDVTPEMIRQAQARFEEKGLSDAEFIVAPAERMPFPAEHFDAVVSRLTLHHVADPVAVVAEMARVLKSGGRMVAADVVSSEDADESRLHNAIEVLRDPSHTRMLPLSELVSTAQSIGLRLLDRRDWVQRREFEEWMKIANAPERTGPLRAVMEALARAGARAGINLRAEDGQIWFDHHLVMLVLDKP